MKTGEDKLKQEIINDFTNIVGRNEKILTYCDVQELRRRLEENLLTVTRGDLTYKYGFPKKLLACVFGKNMLLRNGQTADSPVVFHEALHMASSTFIEEGNVTIWKSGLEVSKAPTDFFKIAIRNANDIDRINEYESQVEAGPYTGLNEGITQWLTRMLINQPMVLPRFNKFQQMGISIVNETVYPTEQSMVEQFAAFYGEECVIRAYFENTPELLTERIARSGTIDNPGEKFMKFSSLVDKLYAYEEPEGKKNAKEYLEMFFECQNFFLEELVKPEIEATFKTEDKGKIQDIRERIEKLQQLGFKRNGKNFYDDIALEFNEKIAISQLDISPLTINNEKLPQKISRKIGQAVSPIGQTVTGVKVLYKSIKNLIEERKKLVSAFSALPPGRTSVKGEIKTENERLRKLVEDRKMADFSGLGNLTPEEREAKYREAELVWKEHKAQEHGKNSHEQGMQK